MQSMSLPETLLWKQPLRLNLTIARFRHRGNNSDAPKKRKTSHWNKECLIVVKATFMVRCSGISVMKNIVKESTPPIHCSVISFRRCPGLSQHSSVATDMLALAGTVFTKHNSWTNQGRQTKTVVLTWLDCIDQASCYQLCSSHHAGKKRGGEKITGRSRPDMTQTIF